MSVNIGRALRDKGLMLGRMISYSKSNYMSTNPNNVCCFNASIISNKEGQAWTGDLDLTKDGALLKEAAIRVEETLYIVKEYNVVYINNGNDVDIEKSIANAMWNTTLEIPTK